MIRALSAVLCMFAIALAGCGGDDDDSGGSADKTESGGASAQTVQKQGVCRDVEQPTPRDDGGQKKPTKLLSKSKTYDVTLETTCGSFTIRLDQKTSPNATASFVALAWNGFFDDTIFHRIVPGFVIQAGDPTVTGDGDPGYTTRDKVPQDVSYTRGTVAMGKSGSEPSGTAGSQFFVITGSGASLTPDYAVLGKVTKGMDAVQAIGKLGNPASGDTGTPLQSVVIEKVTIREH